MFSGQFGYCLAAATLVAACATQSARAQASPAEQTVDCSAFSSVPLPPEAAKAATPKTAPDCASYRSYRGIGRPVDYAKARECAWQERLAQKANLGQNQKEGTAWVVGGSLILADIYFNGSGVERNIPLAMRLACEAEERMVVTAAPEIAKLGSSLLEKPFELCDFAATTFTMTFCNDYTSEIEENRRNRLYESLKSSMTRPQQEAFEKLLGAREAYIRAHGSEVDQGGTIRAMRTIGSEDILQDLFRTDLLHFERKRWPVFSERQLSSADASLNREYEIKVKKLRTKSAEQIEDGAVTAANLQKVQASWREYREIWVAFAKLRYPAHVPAIRAKITVERYRLLRTIN